MPDSYHGTDSCTLRLCLDQGFGEEKRNENGNGNGRWSNGPMQLDRQTFPFLFPFSSPKTSSKYSLKDNNWEIVVQYSVIKNIRTERFEKVKMHLTK